MDLSVLATVLGWLGRAGRALVGRPRASLALVWCHPGIWVVGDPRPTPEWRGIRLEVTAARSEEFPVERADWEYRSVGGLRWRTLQAQRVPFSPWVVPANRSSARTISARPLAAALPVDRDTWDIRLRLYRPHGRPVASEPMRGVETEELRRERIT